jgi:hypothetical protein
MYWDWVPSIAVLLLKKIAKSSTVNKTHSQSVRLMVWSGGRFHWLRKMGAWRVFSVSKSGIWHLRLVCRKHAFFLLPEDLQ